MCRSLPAARCGVRSASARAGVSRPLAPPERAVCLESGVQAPLYFAPYPGADAQRLGGCAPAAHRRDDFLDRLSRLAPACKTGLIGQCLHSLEGRGLAIPVEGGGVFTVGARAEGEIVGRGWVPLALIVKQERPVLAVIVLVAGEQVKEGATKQLPACARVASTVSVCPSKSRRACSPSSLRLHSGSVPLSEPSSDTG